MQTFKTEELVQIAKRDNNTKRPYLLVNPLQGKHIPVSPAKALEVFDSMAELLSEAYPGERLLIVGFAETATAIGAAVAVNCPQAVYYMHTTREWVERTGEYLYFSEVHSHATEQKLIADRLDQMITLADRMVFVEDEVTTGNTILNLIRQIKSRYPERYQFSFGIISILNSMADSVLEEFLEQGIRCLYLNRIENRSFSEELEGYRYDPECRHTWTEGTKNTGSMGSRLNVTGKQDPRIGVVPEKYNKACEKLAESCLNVLKQAAGSSGKRILVLGTEELMYPALLTADRIEREGEWELVRFHATTRSPILPSGEPDYPLHVRSELRSVYDGERITFLYNLEAYDFVLWIHDATEPAVGGEASLTAALNRAGCRNIMICKWGD